MTSRVSDDEVRRAAKAAVTRFGQAAIEQTLVTLESYRKLGDLVGIDAWERIHAAVAELVRPLSSKTKPSIKLTKSGHVKWW